MKSKLIQALTATAIAGGILVGSPVPALAASSDCPDKYVCMWEDSSYGGDMWVKYRAGSISLDKFEIDGWDGDNELSSLVNNTDLYVILFADDDWDGATRCYNPRSKVSSLESFDNEAESFILSENCQF